MSYVHLDVKLQLNARKSGGKLFVDGQELQEIDSFAQYGIPLTPGDHTIKIVVGALETNELAIHLAENDHVHLSCARNKLVTTAIVMQIVFLLSWALLNFNYADDFKAWKDLIYGAWVLVSGGLIIAGLRPGRDIYIKKLDKQKHTTIADSGGTYATTLLEKDAEADGGVISIEAMNATKLPRE